ncbi:alkaline phosphatase family protein [Haloferax sp. ATB1]|uniref:alkaline phosphatase family protein n=1 Tax=Haloferax sp. ATB1 TaxID=1508454 RepID=UPI0006937D10|nr:alkaline phosphatase family protein [Haloferax sp. ATB1]
MPQTTNLPSGGGAKICFLETHDHIESFSYSTDLPITTEVWTTVATGVHPEEHGIVATGEQQEWKNPVLQTLSKVTPYVLPKDLRVRLGTILRGDEEDSAMVMRQTDVDTIFPHGSAFGWPGVTPARHLSEAWHLLEQANANKISTDELLDKSMKNTGIEFGWLIAAADLGYPVVGVHSHILDIAGHAFARREKKLKEVYTQVDRLVGMIQEHTDRLVILSDHGMQVEWLDDESPGDHSLRPFISSNFATDLPDDMYSVRPWVESQITANTEERDESVGIDTTHQQLKDLGYLE